MSAGSPVSWGLAVVMVLVAGYRLTRIAQSARRARAGGVDVDLTHAAMGGAMALMLAGFLTSDSSHGWAVGFAGPAAWFFFRALLSYVRAGAAAIGHPLRQAVLGGAMLSMLLARANESGMPGMPRMDPALSVLLTVAVGAVALVTARSMRRPTLDGSCQLAMNATTIYMLLLMA